LLRTSQGYLVPQSAARVISERRMRYSGVTTTWLWGRNLSGALGPLSLSLSLSSSLFLVPYPRWFIIIMGCRKCKSTPYPKHLRTHTHSLIHTHTHTVTLQP